MIPSKEQLVNLLKELDCDPKVKNGRIAIIDYARQPMEEVIVFYLEQLRNFANQAKSA